MRVKDIAKKMIMVKEERQQQRDNRDAMAVGLATR